MSTSPSSPADPGVEVVPVINQGFQDVMASLRSHAGRETKEMSSTVMRLFQVEEHLKRHLDKK